MKRLITLVIMAITAQFVFGQTTLISPTGDGGFENGTTFAANGWTSSNSANNPWVVGTAISTPPFSNRSAYVSNDGGTTNSYTNSLTALNYFYRDVVVPAGQTVITLTFNWVCNGESTWDLVQVFVAPTSVVPVGTMDYPGSGLTLVPVGITGATFIGSANLQTTIQTATFSIPGSFAGTTMRLIFAWKDDSSGGSNPGGSIDNISLTSAVPATYTWLATSGIASWATAGSWSPARNTPAVSDILVFNQGGNSTATSIPTETVGRISVSNNTTINLQAGSTVSLVIASDGTSADELSVASGSTLMINGAIGGLTITYTGTGSTGNIAGTMELTSASGTVVNAFTCSGGTSSVTTVSGTLANGQSGGTGVPTITSTAATLVFTATGIYDHKFTTSNGTIPTATWNVASSCKITGYTAPNMVPAGLGQTFGNFTWNCTGQGANIYNLAQSGSLFNVAGTLSVLSTGTGALQLGITGSYTINSVNVIVSGGTLDLQSGASGTPSLNVSGTLTQSSGMILSSATGTGNSTLNFNGTTNQAITFANQPTGPITYRVSNPLGITLSAPFTNFVIGNGTSGGLRISTAYATPITLAGSLTTFQYNAANSTLTYDAAGFTTASALIFPVSNGPTSLTVNTGAGFGISIPFDRTISNTLALTSGDVYMGTYTLTLGTSTSNVGTLSGTSGSIIGNFKRWFAASTGSKDFLIGIPGVQRKATINFTVAPGAGGTLTASFVPTDPGTTGLPLTEGAITVNTASKSGYWRIDAGDGLTGGTYTGLFTATNFPGVNSYAGLVLIKRPSGGGSWVLDGTHVTTIGSNTVPVLSRIGMTGFSEFGVGGDVAVNPMSGTTIFSIANGNWGDVSTWSTNTVPASGDYVTISPGNTVATAGGTPPYGCFNLTIAATGTLNVSGNDIVIGGILTNNGTFNSTAGTTTITGAATTGVINAATTGTFTVSGGTVTLGPIGGGNRTFTNNGTLTVTSTGTLNINGNFANTSSAGNIFTQSGGNINVDGNAGGVAANSVASGTYLVAFSLGTPTTVIFSGGTFTIVDPHASSTSSYALSGGMSTAVNCSLSHTFVFGNGTSTDPAPGGFYIYLFPGSSYLILGNVTVNGSSGRDRFLTSTSTVGILGNLTINSGGELRTNSSNNYFAGNITVNSNGILSNPNTLSLASFANATATPATAAQTISGTGYFRNLIPTASVSSGGTGYVVGDILTVVGGTYTNVAKFVVASVSAGAVSTVTAIGYANYSVAPTTPASTTGGTGTGCTLTSLTNLTPTAGMNSFLVNNSNATGVTISIPISVSGTLTLTTGKVNTTSTNILQLGTATTAGTLSGGSSTAYIIGPFARTFPASRTATGTFTTSTLYPVGKGTTYLPLWIDPSTTSGGAVIFKGEAFTSNSGSGGGGVSNLSQARWEALITSGSTYFMNSYLMIGDVGIGSTQQILQATSAAGTYNGIPVSTIYTAGTPNTLKTGSSITSVSFYGYFAYGNLVACTMPGSQPTGLSAIFKSSTGFTVTFIPAFPPPSNYLVVRYASGATATPPVDYTLYTVGGALGTGIVRSVSNATSVIETGLAAGTTYDYYIYSYNNSACYGPVYRTGSPLWGSLTTCASAVGVPGTPTSSLVTAVSFRASWTASSTPSVNYLLDVATDINFTTFVSGYAQKNVGTALFDDVTGLSPATTYYVRVRAVDPANSCYSDYSGTLTQATDCNAESIPTTNQSFESTSLPVCWSTALITGTTNWAPATSNDGVPSAHTGSYFMGKVYTNSDALLFSQPINMTTSATGGRINVWIYRSTVNHATDRIRFHINTSKNLTGATQLLEIFPLYTVTPTVPSAGWYNYTVNIPSTYNSNTVIYIIAQGTTTASYSSYGLGFDDFMVEAIPNAPAINVNPPSLAFGYVPSGGTSSEMTYTLSGQFLNPPSGDITITPPPNFEVSFTTLTGFSSGPITKAYTGSTLAATTIFVVFKPTSPLTDYSGNIANNGGGAPTANVAVTGTTNLVYCASNASTTADEDIFNVTIGTLNNSSDCFTTGGAGSIMNEYSNYRYLTAPDLQLGSANAFSVTSGTCGGNYGNAFKIFIDYDQDGDFSDAGEEVYVSPSSTTGPHSETGNITVPSGAALGNTVMRVICRETSTPSSITACGTYSWGETEDYTLNITAGTSPLLSVAPGSLNFGTIPSGSTSAEMTYSLSGMNLDPASGDITITPPANFEVSLTTGSGFSPSPITKSYTGGTLAATTIFVVFKPTTPSTPYSGNISNAGGLAPTVDVAVSGASACEVAIPPFIQDFEETLFPPECWTNVAVTGTYLWERSTDASAYGIGTASAFANFYGQTSGTYELKSLDFNISALSTPTLKFDYAYAAYETEIDEMDVYYSVNNGTSWNLLLAMPGGPTGILNTAGSTLNSFVPTSSQWGTQTLALPGGTNKLKFQAISAYGNNLYLDNIHVYSPLAHDVAAISIDLNQVVPLGTVDPKATVKNEGANTETFTVTMTIGTYSSTKTVTALAAGASLQVTFDPWTNAVGEYAADVTTNLSGDQDAGNNTILKGIKVMLLNKLVYGYNSSVGSSDEVVGPTSFNVAVPGVLASIANQSALQFVTGGTWANGLWYGTVYNTVIPYDFITINTSTGARTVIGDMGIDMTGLSYDVINNIMYAVNGTDLYTINIATGLPTLVGSNTGILMINLAINAGGQAYAVDIIADVLGTVNLSTGAFTPVGPIGFDANYAQDMEFDRETGELFMAAYTTNGFLAWVDRSTGEALKIGDFEGGSEITGFAIPYTSGINQWTGLTSTAWDNNGNWSLFHVPYQTEQVVIPTITDGGRFPVIGNGVAAACFDVTIETNATLIVEPGGSLTVIKH